MSLGFIRYPYPDEILYSFLVRLYKDNGSVPLTLFKEILFEYKKININLHYPQWTSTLVRNLGDIEDLSERSLIENHTLINLIKPFLTSDLYEKSYKAMLTSDAQLKTSLRFHHNSMFSDDKDTIKVCPLCYFEDIEKHQQPYIHRIHNVIGVKTCYKHGCNLDVTKFHYFSAKPLWDIEEMYVPYGASYPTEELKPFFQDLNDDIWAVLNGALNDYNFQMIVDKINTKLKTMGIYTSVANRRNPFYLGFMEYYPDEFLEIMESKVIMDDSNWLQTIRTPNASNPIRILLVIRYLFGGIEGLINYEEEDNPLGKGPFPCLNIVCPDYHKEVIDTYETRIHDNKLSIVGTFTCKTCGFSYTRKSKMPYSEDKFYKTQIRDRGHLWLGKLKEMIETTDYSTYKLAQIFDAEKRSIVRFAEQLGVKHHLNTSLSFTPKSEPKMSIDLDAYKQVIIDYIKQNPNASRVDIRTDCRKYVTSVQNYDNEWLMSVLPDTNYLSNSPGFKTQEEWASLDEELYTKSKAVIDDILKNNVLQRISVNSMSKMIPYKSLSMNMKNSLLPKTNTLLNEYCETASQYVIRKTNILETRGY